jgi:hypothetical protein
MIDMVLSLHEKSAGEILDEILERSLAQNNRQNYNASSAMMAEASLTAWLAAGTPQ